MVLLSKLGDTVISVIPQINHQSNMIRQESTANGGLFTRGKKKAHDLVKYEGVFVTAPAK